MPSSLLTLKSRNLYGNIGAGMCLLVVGLALALRRDETASLLCAVLLLALAGAALGACLSRRRERADEMSAIHDGQASAFALKTTLIALGVLCCLGIVADITVNLGAACCLAVGFALTLYGVSFAWLERC